MMDDLKSKSGQQIIITPSSVRYTRTENNINRGVYKHQVYKTWTSTKDVGISNKIIFPKEDDGKSNVLENVKMLL